MGLFRKKITTREQALKAGAKLARKDQAEAQERLKEATALDEARARREAADAARDLKKQQKRDAKNAKKLRKALKNPKKGI
jgi:hypothetical protein